MLKRDKRDKRIIEVKQDEDLTYLLVGFGEGEKNVTVKVNGRGASVQILGIILAKEGTITIHTFQIHQQPDTTSDLLIKSVLFGDAKLNYDGLIKIEKDAQRSNAYQRNENLLLSDKAYVETKPELEILANDVRCTHGATIGRMDEEELFYIMSRGVDRKEAERLVIEGFLVGVLERVGDKVIRDKIMKQIQKRLSI